MEEQRIILLLSDLHCGSIWGLWPSDFKLIGGNKIVLNPIQEELERLYSKFQEDVGDYDTVILLGDLINGVNRNEVGKHLVVADMVEQKKACIKLLKPICKNKLIFGISGSRYHGSEDYEIDREIIEHFGGYFGGAVANVKIKGPDKVLHIRHGKGAMPDYTGTRMEREINLLLLAERMGKVPNADAVVMAHFHIYRRYDAHGKIVILNPCWEGPRFNIYNSAQFLKYQPDIGATKLIITSDSIEVIPYKYPLRYPRELTLDL